MRSKKHAFTLIELLVVIAIIAILAAILFPVFARAREAARKISCLSDVKQLATATLMYSQDYDEVFPGMEERGDEGDAHPLVGPAFSGFKGNESKVCAAGNKNTPADALYPYTKNDGIFQCPNLNERVVRHDFPLYANKVFSGDPALAGNAPTETRYAGSFLWFCAHANPLSATSCSTNLGDLFYLLIAIGRIPLGDSPDNYLVCAQTQASIGRPANKPMFIDDSWGTNHEGLPNDVHLFLPQEICNAAGITDRPCTPTSNGWNTGFADGHAKYSKLSFYRTIDEWVHPNGD